MGNLTLASLGERVGQELGLSDWVTIDQPRIDTFASCTGDHQWIHVNPARAATESPFTTWTGSELTGAERNAARAVCVRPRPSLCSKRV